ncbi:hypothetical protein [Kocuria rosea]|uniref:hypothetical protein n=1 Tax=Kocuria rosea TaxID=1275 RepID=UPI00203DAFF5|nr:hypothetical protein [Kocuria rosea]
MTTEHPNEDLPHQGFTEGTTAVFSMKKAAEVAGVSVSTLRRRRDDLIAAGADISPDGWRVPMTALVACGLIAGEGPQPAGRSPRTDPHHGNGRGNPTQAQRLEELTAQVRNLEREVEEWRRRAEVAEARAEERGRALDALRVANETERMALRMLTAGTTTPVPLQPTQESTSPTEPAAPTPPPQPPAPVGHPPASPRQEPPRKGFLSRVMGL